MASQKTGNELSFFTNFYYFEWNTKLYVNGSCFFRTPCISGVENFDIFNLNSFAIFNCFHLKENNEKNWKEIRRKIADLNTTELRILKHGKSKSHHTPDGQCTLHTECLIY